MENKQTSSEDFSDILSKKEDLLALFSQFETRIESKISDLTELEGKKEKTDTPNHTITTIQGANEADDIFARAVSKIEKRESHTVAEAPDAPVPAAISTPAQAAPPIEIKEDTPSSFGGTTGVKKDVISLFDLDDEDEALDKKDPFNFDEPLSADPFTEAPEPEVLSEPEPKEAAEEALVETLQDLSSPEEAAIPSIDLLENVFSDLDASEITADLEPEETLPIAEAVLESKEAPEPAAVEIRAEAPQEEPLEAAPKLDPGLEEIFARDPNLELDPDYQTIPLVQPMDAVKQIFGKEEAEEELLDTDDESLVDEEPLPAQDASESDLTSLEKEQMNAFFETVGEDKTIGSETPLDEQAPAGEALDVFPFHKKAKTSPKEDYTENNLDDVTYENVKASDLKAFSYSAIFGRIAFFIFSMLCTGLFCAYCGPSFTAVDYLIVMILSICTILTMDLKLNTVLLISVAIMLLSIAGFMLLIIVRGETISLIHVGWLVLIPMVLASCSLMVQKIKEIVLANQLLNKTNEELNDRLEYGDSDADVKNIEKILDDAKQAELRDAQEKAVRKAKISTTADDTKKADAPAPEVITAAQEEGHDPLTARIADFYADNSHTNIPQGKDREDLFANLFDDDDDE